MLTRSSLNARGIDETHALSWRSRATRAVVALVLLVLLVRLVWGWYVGRSLQTQLDELRQRGEPVDASDFVFDMVPDAENAALLLDQAARALVDGIDSPRNSTFSFDDYLPYPPQWMTLAAASERAHAPAFALVRKARGYRRAQYCNPPLLPFSANFMRKLNHARMLANTLADGALYAHVQGDDAEAVERVRDVLHMSRSLRQDDFLVYQLVAMGIDALACNTAYILAPGLQLKQASDAARRVSRAQVCELISELLDEELAWEGVQRSLRMERVAYIDVQRQQSGDMWLIRPLSDLEIVRFNRNMAITTEASQWTTKPEVEAVLARCRWEYSSVSHFTWWTGGAAPKALGPRYSRWFLRDSTYPSRYLETHFRILSDRRATAVSLAAQLFRADRGCWPATLEELVPDYLPSVPSDPYYADRRPLGYVLLKSKLPDGGDRPLVWYDAGDTQNVLILDEPMYGWQTDRREGTRREVRQYRDLSRFVPASKKAVDDNPEKSDAPRQQPESNNAAD